jgi:isovaleryl-CoA dehydrogenase
MKSASSGIFQHSLRRVFLKEINLSNSSASCRTLSSTAGTVIDTEIPPRASSSRHLHSQFNPSQEHLQLRNLLRSFTASEIEPQANHFNKHEQFNLPLFKSLHSLGLTQLTIEDKYNGAGMDATAVAIVHEEMSYSDPAFCLSYLAHEVLFLNNLGTNGNDAQKQKWFVDKNDGGNMYIGGMCMSEPNAGTDVLGMKTTAKLSSDGNWILNGQKMWITNGTIDGETTGDVYLVYAKTGEMRTDISQFIVEKDMKGFMLGQQIKDKLGMRASPTAELVFDNVLVPNENLVGEINGGSLCMMRNLEIERVALAAMAIGIARRCVDEMVKYSMQRSAFGKEIRHFGQIQKAISESYAEYMAGKCYLYMVANSLDLQSTGNGLDADGVKLYSAVMAKNVADRAIQVMGGYGYVGEYNVERLWRDSKLLEIGGGTNESHHKNMIRDLCKMGDSLP